MPLYSFRYVDAEGLTHHGEAESADRESLVRELQAKGTVLEVTERPGRSEAKTLPRGPRRGLRLPMSREGVALYTRQMATMLTAGLPIMKILAIMRKRCTNVAFAEVLDEVSRLVQGGTRFSEALSKHPEVFDAMYVSLVKVGEASGKLAPMVERLADLVDKELALERRVRSAMSYPSFILAFTVILSWVIVAFLMPLFAPMFATAGLNLQENYPLTYYLLQISKVVNHPLGLVLTVVGVGVALVGGRHLLTVPAVRQVLDTVLNRIPVVNTLLRNAAVARFSRTLSTLMFSGMPLLQSLQLVSGAAGNTLFKGATERLSNRIAKGSKISDAIESESKVFPDLLIQMAQVGEESGALPQMLERAADYYDSQLDAAVQRLVSLLEPLMMIMVGAIVCVFVLAVLLPILGLAQLK